VASVAAVVVEEVVVVAVVQLPLEVENFSFFGGSCIRLSSCPGSRIKNHDRKKVKDMIIKDNTILQQKNQILNE
jgi:hypothetical protein